MITDVFCKIIKGELKSETVSEDQEFIVIKDIKPNAPVHLLVIPKEHFFGLGDIEIKKADLIGRAFILAHKVAMQSGLEKGYRLVVNEGEHGGKLVPHFHIHVLGGKRLGPKIVSD